MDPTVELLLSKVPPSDLEKGLQWFRTYLPVSKLQRGENNIHRSQWHLLPFQVIDKSAQDGERPFLTCTYSEVGSGLYRSPWTNHLHNVNQEHVNSDIETCAVVVDVANQELRDFEVKFSQVWDAYKNLYYGQEAVGSVYLNNVVDSDNASDLEGCFCLQKLGYNFDSSWNSASFVRAKVINKFECEYSIDTFVCVTMNPITGCNDEQSDSTTKKSCKIDFGSTVSKTCKKTCKIQPEKVSIYTSHIEHIGTIIEANEIEIRSNLERVVIPKHQEIIVTIQKKQTQRRPQVNPLMGMMMNSDMLKKRIAKSNAEG